MNEILAHITTCDKKSQVMEKVKQAMKKRYVPPHVINNIFGNRNPGRSMSAFIIEKMFQQRRPSPSHSELINKAIKKGLIAATDKDKLLASTCTTGSQTSMHYWNGKIIVF
ncbi:uncharacterized protein LOC111349417 [Spodoptera litura]|uniref:Uncharacterized protein LOC111349417 n=1 Tax=Spodoptera litura TaxID=69820 RepID=A0A9J7DU05_SPOLT|nr:uncharacterized protein LOC111349417 [Spodoptera litura]